MRNSPWIGLLAAGPMSPALFRISNLHVHLGPVASASLRVASRLANRLKAGAAVPPDSLQQAELILLTGPESAFPELLLLALSSGIDWRGRTAILLDSRRDSSSLDPFRALGASVGTLDSLDAFPDPRFAADADAPARRRLQRFATATASSIFYLEQGRKLVFAGSADFTATFLSTLIAATVDRLKTAGLTQAEAILIAERNTLHTLRSSLKSGRKGSTGFIPDGALEAMHRCIIGTMDDSQAQRFAAAGRLAANLAHDWNNLLTLLAAQAAEIAHALPPDHPAQPLTAALNNTIGHAADSPRRLLSWLREEPSTSVRVDLNDAIRQALPLVHLAVGRGVQCLTDLTATPLPLPLDQPLFLNALLNLASNASTAMSGRGKFTIGTTAEGKDINLIVEDTGPGMDHETRQRIFEPFFSTGRANGGTGLGLETVKAFAESHDATVTVDTAPDQGCRFTLRLRQNL